MRIAIVGNSGTGKTTLAEELAVRLNLPLIPEIARDLLAEWRIADLRSMGSDQMSAFQQEILQRKLLLESLHQSFVADRSTADSAAIWLIRLVHLIDAQRSTEFVEQCRAGIRRYQHVFLLPSDKFFLKDDGVRQMNAAKRQLFDAALTGFLVLWQCPFHIVEAASLEDRISEIRLHIKI